MICDEIEKLIFKRHEEALTESETRIVQSHLRTCEKCSKRMELADETLKLHVKLDEITEHEIPKEFTDRVHARLEPIIRHHKRRHESSKKPGNEPETRGPTVRYSYWGWYILGIIMCLMMFIFLYIVW